ncbi:MAG: hypothetical protein A3G34_00515 [Candidatus Lindowbacteria bacterium RIFCSPLOWO2_12_FULL_62_27]|nr:MAG: hypothetical protein A3G34_00515 [Candidatus Lindowbacteria bacterium RIFCSPLOWO2_12_FULL_62_27]OGH58202.1 MAG: hypothetical protein A3I06_01040 [Candidatus Lindowbacteria bacterium RIFCSPLOWO2_02_FULL_62_12]
MKVLIVDDSRLTRQVIRKTLGGEFEVVEAADGPSAIAQLASWPDLVLLANTLMDGSGYSLCSSVRSLHQGGDIPIFLMGASAEPTDYAAGFEAGASGYLTKPFEKEDLLNLLMLLSSRTTFARGATALVVDDSKSVRVVLKKTLLNAGFEVVEAENGREGLDRLGQQRIDVISLDYEMPVLDGLGFMRSLNNTERLARPPVLMLTSRSDEEARQRAESAGVDAFLTKPFQTDQYLKTLVGLVSRAVDYSAYTVFFVDDSAVTRKKLDLLLIGRGFQRKGFDSGVSLLKFFDVGGRDDIPDLILLDLLMPGIDGITVLKNLRAREGLGRVPVVMISGYGKSTAIVAALNAGANDFIVKPYNEDEVLARINIHLKPKEMA